jgi:hypothetical protein
MLLIASDAAYMGAQVGVEVVRLSFERGSPLFPGGLERRTWLLFAEP